jgi:NAD(P)-dependent dehydrogenase (short-subunit alcohol dehydrogenase family)
MSNFPNVFDKNGLAVITGGASGFGYVTSKRLLSNGMSVAILDVSEKELQTAKVTLTPIAEQNHAKVFGFKCNVTVMDDCVAAQKAIANEFKSKKISFLFNNAGIQGNAGFNILGQSTETWKPIFAVNVYGSVNILQAFTQSIIDAGPLASGKKTHIVTTSSVVGLLNHNPGAYSVSKMAVTAVCEQYAIELENMGSKAIHIAPHTLHPTAAATNFMELRDADGKKRDEKGSIKAMTKEMGAVSADFIIDGLFNGLDMNQAYIIVDHPLDIPTGLQLAARVADQINQTRPRPARPLAMMVAPDKKAERELEIKLLKSHL